MHNLKFWEKVLQYLNEIPFSYKNFNKNNIQLFLFTNASGNSEKGCGAWDTKGNWFSLPWSITKFYNSCLVKNNENNELEFITMAAAFLYFSDLYEITPTGISCGNQVSVGWFISKAPAFSNKFHKFISYLIRRMAVVCLKRNIFICIDYINTKENKRANARSRLEANPLKHVKKGYKVARFKKRSSF